jgi:hypothetical protein
LADPDQRARSHHDDHTAEAALLIDPGRDDPEEHIGFRREIAFPVDGGQHRQVTIDICRLNRAELAERRLDRLRLLQTLQNLLRLPTNGAEYVSMARWLLRDQN